MRIKEFQDDVCDRAACASYRPGHLMHWIQAKLTARNPWGWRDVIVIAAEGRFIELRYLVEDVEFTAWHHDALGLAPAEVLRVNQSHGMVLQGRFGQVYVAHDSPLAAVPTPEHPELWAAEASVGVVDLGTGRGINIHREFGAETV